MDSTRATHPWLAFICGVVGLCLIAASCSGSDTEGATNASPTGTIRVDLTKEDGGTPKPGGDITYGLSAESDGFSPSVGRWAPSTYIVGFSIMDPLAAYDDQLEVQPYLAKAFESNKDFTEWTIRLRDGVKLHNGQPVDAALIKLNLETQQASPLTGEVMSFVKSKEDGGITAVDPLTVVVKMRKPWSTFPHTLTAQVGAISDQKTLTTPEGNKAPMGSGPFVFDEWTPGKNLTVHKNPNYWRKGFPYLDSIDFQVLPDIQARGASLESGTVNIFETNDPAQILSFTEKATNDKASGVQIFSDQKGDGAEIFVGLNTAKAPFNDPIARQAVAYAGNVVQLSEQAYSGVFPPAYGPFSENSPFFSQPADYPRHDLVKAQALADEYEKKYGKKLEFTANIIPVPEIAQVAQVLQAQLAVVGITVHLQSMEQAKLIVDALTGNYEATGFILFGSPHLDREYVFISSPPKPVNQLSLNFTRNGLNSDGTPNTANDKIVAAMDQARTTLDPAIQKEQYSIVQAEMAKNLNYLFLVRQTTALVYDKDVRGAKVYTLPDASGGPGKTGMPQPVAATFTFNLWLAA